MIRIDLMKYKDRLRLKSEAGKKFVFSEVRQKWLVLQPEELVRQLIIQHLITEKEYNKNKISTERSIKVNRMDRRFDIVVYNDDFNPYILIECKSPKVKITQQTFEQAAWYNMSLKVDYLVVTNGIQTYCCAMDYVKKSYQFLEDLPRPT